MSSRRFFGLAIVFAIGVTRPVHSQEVETPYEEPAVEEEEGYEYEGGDEAEYEDEDDAGYVYEDESVIHAALEETLSQPEFARLRSEPEPEEEETSFQAPEWIDRFTRWLARVLWGDDATEEEPSNFAFDLPGARLLIYGMALLILAVALFFIVKSVVAISRDKKTTLNEDAVKLFGPESAPGEQDPDEYWRRALSHGEKRNFKEGMRELLLGSMSVLERKGLIRFRRGLTNRDYYYSARGTARESFSLIASAFEHVYFGRREATADAFRDSCRAYQKSFREAAS